MALEKFDLETLAKIDEGRIKNAFELALRRCIDDCNERPAFDKTRKVSLVVMMTPVADEMGNLDEVTVAFDIGETVPKRQSREYSMQVRGKTQRSLFFNELSPDDIKQMTIDESGPRRVAEDDDELSPAERAAAAK